MNAIQSIILASIVCFGIFIFSRNANAGSVALGNGLSHSTVDPYPTLLQGSAIHIVIPPDATYNTQLVAVSAAINDLSLIHI